MAARRQGSAVDFIAILLAVIIFLLCAPTWVQANPHRALIVAANKCYQNGERAVLLTDKTLVCRQKDDD